MMENMNKGIIQVIGNDKAGRVAFYICTARDKPQSKYRAESRKNFDMFISYGTRLRPESKRCQMTMLINQDKASMFSNLDMTFQADIALRIAKFYPGCVDKMYICKMGRTLSALAKPIFSGLPSIVSNRIIIISDGDIKKGKLLELFDEDVLPVALGGTNDCDHPENYARFANTIKDYFEQLKAAISRGTSVKEWELENCAARVWRKVRWINSTAACWTPTPACDGPTPTGLSWSRRTYRGAPSAGQAEGCPRMSGVTVRTW
ncbi:hypothetical protein AGDE_14271 [Angomonas deanei]|uniref:CRAL/TRIO domain containing protein, putative n=1 Tax=Angomonas deanei TaxID=59799 RepID=A0A7G2C3E3_9TRYP|nr:hypothetical protein AGDE_14271 [Angomonas deanei]CAD2214035.1 CRAL/TRIO domain containing protein, putative [Angomonas deanei]|eukprot:EPY21127.1 hypothetical protein AGDE_14271 [Angomonas deanei]